MVPRRRPGVAAALSLAAVLPLAAACGSATPDAADLVRGALAQQYFDQHHAIPGDEAETQLEALAAGLLSRVYAMPAPQPAAQPIRIDVPFIRRSHGDAGVQEALLAAYILHFHALPDDAARQQIANLMGNGEQTPLPVPGMEQ